MDEIIFTPGNDDVEIKIVTPCSTSYLRVVLSTDGYYVELNSIPVAKAIDYDIDFDDYNIAETNACDSEIIDSQEGIKESHFYEDI